MTATRAVALGFWRSCLAHLDSVEVAAKASLDPQSQHILASGG